MAWVHAWKACVGKLTGVRIPLSATHPGGAREPRQVREEATVVGAFRALGGSRLSPGWVAFIPAVERDRRRRRMPSWRDALARGGD